MGPGITKVRSLKMDRKVWTEELIEVVAQSQKALLGANPSALWSCWLWAGGCWSTAGLVQADSRPLGGHHGVAWLGRGTQQPCILSL